MCATPVSIAHYLHENGNSKLSTMAHIPLTQHLSSTQRYRVRISFATAQRRFEKGDILLSTDMRESDRIVALQRKYIRAM